jgi:hypothetical protein
MRTCRDDYERYTELFGKSDQSRSEDNIIYLNFPGATKKDRANFLDGSLLPRIDSNPICGPSKHKSGAGLRLDFLCNFVIEN